MTNNTGNPIGSMSPKDLKDNAYNLELLLLGPNQSYPDRKGVPRKSWKGLETGFDNAQLERASEYAADKNERDTVFAESQIEQGVDFNESQSNRVIEFTATQSNRDAQFNAAMAALGYEPPVAYVPGIVMSRGTKTVTYLGNTYRPRSASIPFTTTNWATDEAKLVLVGDGSLRQELSLQMGQEKVGRYGQNLAQSLQNLNGAAALKKFVQRLFENANEKRINTRLVGTSIATLNSASSVFAQALASYFGESKSVVNVFANQAQNPISGWKAQYYSGTYSTRLRGGNGDGAVPIVIQRRAKSITLFYGRELDGGSVGVSIQTANQAAVVQAPIDCFGATAINLPVTYELDPSFTSTITITPPATGFGYLEYYVSDAGDFGMTFFNSAYGGSALWNHTGDGPLGMAAREASDGMYPSAVPSGNLGLVATFAPTNEQVKPALLIYSGPTNDAGNPTNYASQLLSAVTLAVNNGSACILVIEPLAGQTPRTVWDTLRAAYYAAAAAFPDSVFVYDFDAFLSWDLSFNQKFHNPSLGDPHPGDYGYGNPHTAAGYDLCQRMGIPFQRKLGRVAAPDFGRVYTQPNEPLQAVSGSVWIDTSYGATGVRKTLISRGQGWGARGLWACDTGENKVVSFYGQDFLINAPMAFGSRVAGKNFLGDPCAVFSGQSGFDLDSSKFLPGKTYTLSYLYETASATQFNTCFTFGANPFLTVKVAQQAFILSGSSNVSAVNNPGGYGDIKRLVLTFKWPTLDEQAAATAAGVAMNLLRFTVQGGSVANPISVWAFRIEDGSSVTLATKPIVNLATTMPLGPTTASVEPLSSVIQEGGSWSDTSNAPALLKHMLQKDCLVNIAAAAPGIFGGAVNLWRPPAVQANLLEGFVSASTITVVSGGGAVVKGTYGPGSRPGIRWDTGAAGGNTQVEIASAPGSVNLTLGAVYTLSFLVRCGRGDNVIDPIGVMGLYVNLAASNTAGGTAPQLQTDLVSWSNSPGAWKVTQVQKDQQYRRMKLTFKAYAAAPLSGADATNVFKILLLSQDSANQWIEPSEFRLELGASVTAD